MSSSVELEDHKTPILELAARYARAGMRVFPVDMRVGTDGKHGKTPPHGYLWKERASSAVNEVVEDVLAAIEVIGEDVVGIGWALGLDGCLALDLDHDEPPWWGELVSTYTAINRTARGIHLIYRQPDGRRIGNGTSRFPASPKPWGEVRGHGGYVIVAGPDRPGFDVDELLRVQAFPRPDWLSDAGADALLLGLEELRDWLLERSSGKSIPGKVAGYRTRLAAWRPGESRHDTAVTVACWIARESAAGVVNAREAVELLGEWWRRVGERPGRRLTDRELTSVVRWAVGVALTDPARLDEIARTATDYDVEARTVSARMDELVAGVTVELEPAEDPFVSYEAVDLRPWLAGTVAVVTPDLLCLVDGRALLYGGRLNGVHGDSGAGKSWLLALAVAELAALGRRVLVVDLEDTPAPLVSRLRQIGVSDAAILAALVFVHPDASFVHGGGGRLVELARREAVAHVWIDSLGEAFALDGIDENVDAEVAPWLAVVVRRLIDATGAGVTLVDHVTKAADNPLHPSGSKRKRAAITGASWYALALEPFTIAEGGRVALRCGKDRHGYYRKGDTVAELVMSPLDVATGRSSLELVAPSADVQDGRPRDPLDVIVEALETYGEHNDGALEALMSRVAGWGQSQMRKQRELALKRGLIAERRGPNNARLFRFVEPSTNHDEPTNGPEA